MRDTFTRIKAFWYKLKEKKNHFRSKVLNIENNMVVHAPNTNTPEVEEAGFWVEGQSGYTLSQNYRIKSK